MKIIKEGNRPSIIEKRFICRCGCEFIADENDQKKDPRDGDYVVCPTCGKFINWH